MPIELIKLIPWIPLLGAVLCGICCMKPAWRKAPTCMSKRKKE